jgi:hypothetical protein
MSGTDDAPPIPLPPSLRLLRGLVIVLTAVMIAGVISVVALLVIRLPAATVTVPPALPLPEGARAQAVTQGPGWWAVVTEDGRILLYDGGGAPLREIPAPELAGREPE